MEIWAHKGRVGPDDEGNNFHSFAQAYNLGITGIETDLSMTKDGELIIYHPGSMKPDLINLTWNEINSQVKVNDLDSFLDFLNRFPEFMCCLELKQNSKLLVKLAVNKIVRHRLEKRIYLTAFQKRIPILPIGIETDGELLIYAKRICPQIKTHLIATFPFNLPRISKKYSPDAISLGWLPDSRISFALYNYLIHPLGDKQNQIREVKNMGKKVWAGIFNNLNDMEYFANLGIDGIITDDPILGLRFKDNIKSIPSYRAR